MQGLLSFTIDYYTTPTLESMPNSITKPTAAPTTSVVAFRTSPTTNSLHVVLNYTRLFLDVGLLLFYV